MESLVCTTKAFSYAMNQFKVSSVDMLWPPLSWLHRSKLLINIPNHHSWFGLNNAAYDMIGNPATVISADVVHRDSFWHDPCTEKNKIIIRMHLPS